MIFKKAIKQGASTRCERENSAAAHRLQYVIHSIAPVALLNGVEVEAIAVLDLKTHPSINIVPDTPTHMMKKALGWI